MSTRKYDVVLVDIEPAYKSKLMYMLTQPAPYPRLSRRESAQVIVNRPTAIVSCVDLKDAVLLELLIELVGGTVDIHPSDPCD